ncbi:MAG TPA: DUF1365 domain-containing protein [Solirubrobacteraceae bacterium]
MPAPSASETHPPCGHDAAAAVVADTPAIASAIYEGTVRHRRFEVREHEFHYRLALAYIDLDELPSLLGGRLVASRPGPARFRRRHYLGDERVPLAQAVRDVVATRTGSRPSGQVRVLANLSTFGHCFNPVSFYYCMDEAAEGVEAVVAEVTNTPWGERHAYVLSRGDESHSKARGSAEHGVAETLAVADPANAVLAGNFAKALHVSPFMGMDHRYEWRMTTPRETLSVHIANSHEGRVAFDATLALRRRELTSASLARMSARYPASSLRTLALIYAQAARLRLKGVRPHPHPKQSLT